MLNSQAPAGCLFSNACHRGRPFHAGQPGRAMLTCLAATKQSSRSKSATKIVKNANTDVKEAHRIFDEAFITVKSGDGGNGEIVQKGKGRWVPNNKYQPGGQQPKKIWLPATAHRHHQRTDHTSRMITNKEIAPLVLQRGPVLHGAAPATAAVHTGNDRTSNVYSSGSGSSSSVGTLAVTPEQLGAALAGEVRRQLYRPLQLQVQLSLHLLLHMVADVGIMGLPDAGKSSLLKALTKAAPEVAPYPFTTLMPNLGVLASGGPRAVLADLPGLIEGAHTGRGLGRMFLRHLRRTRMIMHVLDCSMEDPATDYVVVREELRMYNPEYCARPHVVVLNKFDLPAASQRCDEVISALLAVSEQHCKDFANEDIKPVPPSAVVLCSAATGEGLGELNRALAEALHPSRVQEVQQHGAAATQVLRPLLPSAASMATAVTKHLEADEETLLAMGNNSWSGVDEEEEDADDEDQPAGPDLEDGWMLELSEKQLLKLLAQDEARSAAREAALAAAGVNPYADESTSPDGSVSAPVGAQRASAQASTSEDTVQESVTPAASSSAGVQGEGKQEVQGSQGGLQGQGGAQEEAGFAEAQDFDLEDINGLEEELTQEELELLRFLQEQEAAGVVTDESSGASMDVSAAAGQVKDSDRDEEAWLLELSEEQLLEMADKQYQGSKRSSS
ncbi:hypothetical protein DUNSADRAFT_399 [Dunaliella salina]|uniref:OBG-type G domain-containing protein n=1 Tax=Dunaliella salina TaxID=3046 RepID=A0ABQ7FZ07_DUNSA|nr:hypothetical protein DUNSADRAFT_399 [Dunaliella salina]|eukprot:KAF5827592.1 hypothetical protein DUNSADRAFT_399 [Dunaliella salina]